MAALTLIAAVPAAAAPLIDGPGVLPEPPSPVLIDRAQDDGTLTLERASLYRVYTLTGDDRLPAAYASDAPFDGTFLLKQVQEDLARMDAGPARREVAAALKAPADPDSAYCGALSTTPLPDSVRTDHFYIQYNAAALDPSLDIGDFEQSLEEAWITEVGTFGWAAPPRHPNAPGGLYHVRIGALSEGLYGYVTSVGTYAGPVSDNPNTAWNDLDADATCMALSQNYAHGFPGTEPRGALDATTAHELNHSIQFGYGAHKGANAPELNFSEGGATWMEDEVQDASNDNYSYLYPEFNSSMGAHAGSEYAYWLTFRGLTERFGTNGGGAGEDVMQEFWELTSRNAAGSLTAMQGALAKQGISLAAAYHDYAIAAKFVRPCGGGSALPLCFEEGGAYEALAGGKPPTTGAVPGIGGGYFSSVEDNYALDWITLPAAGSYDVTVKNTSLGGSLRVTLACDTGASVALAAVPVTLGPGRDAKVAGFNPAGAACQQAVAVITNDSQTAPNPTSSTARSYLLTTAAAPATTTPVVPPSGTGSSAGGAGAAGPPRAASVDPGPIATASRLAVGKVVVGLDGTVLIRARVSGAGTLKGTASARVRGWLLSRHQTLSVARRTQRPSRARMITLRLKAGRTARRVIRRNKGRLRTTTRLVFTPATGARRTKTRRITFRLKR